MYIKICAHCFVIVLGTRFDSDFIDQFLIDTKHIHYAIIAADK